MEPIGSLGELISQLVSGARLHIRQANKYRAWEAANKSVQVSQSKTVSANLRVGDRLSIGSADTAAVKPVVHHSLAEFDG
jgi:hypothetical protein